MLTKKDLSPGKNPSWYNLPGQAMQTGRKINRSLKSRGSENKKKLLGPIKLVNGDITKFGIDAFRGKGLNLSENVADYAIVNAANVIGLGGTGVDGAINKAGGDKLMAERKIIMAPGYMVPGEARATSDGPYDKLR